MAVSFYIMGSCVSEWDYIEYQDIRSFKNQFRFKMTIKNSSPIKIKTVFYLLKQQFIIGGSSCNFGWLIGTARAKPVTVEKHGREVVVVMAVQE